MSRAVLQACWPWLALGLASLAAAWLLLRASRAQFRPGRLRDLHRDQAGSVQSLSFVLTLPLFIMVMLLIVQVSQLMIATVVVHYAAYAAARSAAVWIPADLGSPEGPDCISAYYPDPVATDQVFPELDPTAEDYGPSKGGVTYLIEPGSVKYQKITAAAVLACSPISPSRDVGAPAPQDAQSGDILKAAYKALVPSSSSNSGTDRRLDHKLAYAAKYTDVEVRFFHKNEEPPLATYQLPDDLNEFYFNEVGWQDLITVTVNYKLALLPGPGRLLARYVRGPNGEPDKVAKSIQQQGNLYMYPLTAAITMGNEGEKSVISYAYQSN